MSVAAVNTPDSTVISGPADAVERIAAAWSAQGRKTKALSVSHAFHSALMEPMLPDFADALAEVRFKAPAIPLISNVTGLPADEEIASPDYWVRHVRQPVLFRQAVAHVADEAGYFVELGPAPVLTTAAQHTLDEVDGPEPLLVSSLATGRADDLAFLQAVARLHTAGAAVDWTGWFLDRPAVVDLPTYAFQRERFWLAGGSGRVDAAGLGLVAAGHPLLGAAVEFADRGGCLLTGRLSRSGVSWLADHEVAGTVLVPGAALVEWVLRAGDEVGCVTVEELMLQAPVVVPAVSGLRVQVVVDAAADDGRREVRVYSRPDDGDDAWVCHATGVLTPEPTAAPEGLVGAWPASGAVPVAVEGFYERMSAAGYAYGPAFQGLRSVWRDGDDLLAEVALPEAAGSPDGYGIHPALLDAALHPALLLDWGGEPQDDGKLWLPFTWNRVGLWAAGADTVRVRVSPGEHDATERELRLLVTDAAGTNVLSVGSVTLRPADVGQLRSVRDDDGLFTVRWTPLPLPATVGEDVPSGDDEAPWAVVTPIEAGGDGLAAAERVLSLVQEFLAAPQSAESRLLLVTRALSPSRTTVTSIRSPLPSGGWSAVPSPNTRAASCSWTRTATISRTPRCATPSRNWTNRNSPSATERC